MHWLVHWVVADEPLVESESQYAGKLLFPVEAQSGADRVRQDVHSVVVQEALPYEVLAPVFAREKPLLVQGVVPPAWQAKILWASEARQALQPAEPQELHSG